MEEVRRKGNQIKNDDKEKKFSDLDTFKKGTLEEVKSANYHVLGDLVYGMELRSDEIMDVVDINNFPSEKTVDSLLPGIYEISDNSKTLACFLPDNVKVTFTTDDIRSKSNIKKSKFHIY